MVGLYHKRRAERSASSRIMRIMMRLAFTAGVFIIIGFALTALFFNGSQVKGPLSIYLSSRSGMEVTIRDAEFSPVYPDVIKLYDVSFGNSNIGELYIEYDLRSAFSGEDLLINDLYLNKISMAQEDLVSLAQSRLGFNSVRAQTVRFHGTPLHTEFLSAADATIRLNQVSYSSDDGLTFRSGALSTSNARLFQDEVKSFSIDFTHSADGIAINSFSAAMYGGTVTGRGLYSQTHPNHAPLTAPATEAAAAADKATAAADTATPAADAENQKATAAADTAAPAADAEAQKATAAADTAAPAADADAKKATAAAAPAAPHTGAVTASAPAAPADCCPDADAYIILDELNLSKIIVNDTFTAPAGIVLTSKNTFLKDVILTNSMTHVPAVVKKNRKNAYNGTRLFADRNAHMAQEAASGSDPNKGRSGDDPQSYIMQGISGSMDGLMIHDQAVTGSFKGEVDEISFPNLQTTFEHNTVKADFADGRLNFALRGQVYEGLIQTEGQINFNDRLIELNELKMAKNKMAINPPRLQWIKDSLSNSSIFIHEAQFKDLEFLSYINSLPLSIQAISGTATNLYLHPEMKLITAAPTAAAASDALVAPEIDELLNALAYMVPQEEADDSDTAAVSAAADDKAQTASSAEGAGAARVATDNRDEMFSRPASLKLQLKNMLYTDLLMSETQADLTLEHNQLTVSVPKMRFKESSISAYAQLGLTPESASQMQIKAPDFESADLNSNLIGHMLTGKIDFNIELSGKYAENQVGGLSLLRGSWGNFSLTSDNMLAADFGLDLINGGKKENYSLNGTEIMTAIQGSVAGMANLRTRGDLRSGQLTYSASTALVTSELTLKGQVDLLANTITGTGHMESLARDSSTNIAVKGKVSAPTFDIHAIKRGEKRPGLYLPQYEASAQAKEQTDAASEFKMKKLSATTAAPAADDGKATDTKPVQEAAPAATDNGKTTETKPAEAAPATADDGKAAETKPADEAAPATADDGKAAETKPADEAAPATADDGKAAETKPAEAAPAAAQATADDNKDTKTKPAEESAPAAADKGKAAEIKPAEEAAPAATDDNKGTETKPADEAAPAAADNGKATETRQADAAPATADDGKATETRQADAAPATADDGKATETRPAEEAAPAIADDGKAADSKPAEAAPAAADEGKRVEVKQAEAAAAGGQGAAEAAVQGSDRDTQMQKEADMTEKELLKHAIIDSIIANGTEEDDAESEEELIF